MRFRLTHPFMISFEYPNRRSYDYEDMKHIANQLFTLYEEVPLSTVDRWLKKAGVTARGFGPRTTTYDRNDVILFAIYCACKDKFGSKRICDRTYHQIRGNSQRPCLTKTFQTA